MFKITALLKKVVLLTLILGIGLVTIPALSVSAASLSDDGTPPGQPQITNERLEKVWLHEQARYSRQGRLLDHLDRMVKRTQGYIDRLKENGVDTDALKAALSVFEDAVKEARQVHQSVQGTLASHKGFNADGKVTDRTQALETVKKLGQSLKEFRNILKDPSKVLHEAIRVAREANHSATEPEQGNP